MNKLVGVAMGQHECGLPDGLQNRTAERGNS